MRGPLVLTSIALLAAACSSPSDDVATFKVEPITFARRVTAEGTLKPVKATPVGVPQNATSPMKVSWIADDGALLRKGDVIVRFDETEFVFQRTLPEAGDSCDQIYTYELASGATKRISTTSRRSCGSR